MRRKISDEGEVKTARICGLEFHWGLNYTGKKKKKDCQENMQSSLACMAKYQCVTLQSK